MLISGLLVVVVGWCARHGTASPCPPARLAVYRLSLATHWAESTFPKQYPQWRPPAQWSKTVGNIEHHSPPASQWL